MTLEQLITMIETKPLMQRPRICCDSRKVCQGDVFVAIKGSRFDGNDFIGQAVVAGARFVVSAKPEKIASAEVIETPDTAAALGVLSQAYYGYPSRKLVNVAATGTNGKTTTAYLTRSIISSCGRKCGLVGTIVTDLGSGDDKISSNMTTPDAPELASLSAQMAENGCKYMVMEASSHAIDQSRTVGIDFKAAAFTNLTGDHLDYHKTMEAYLAAKQKLFEKLTPESTAVLNKDDAAADKIAAACPARVLFYSLNQPADITAQIVSMDINGTVYNLTICGKKASVRTALLGRHNISNHLAAAGLAYGCGFDIEQIAEGLSKMTKVPGRLERIASSADFTVLVDYAHTDDALQNVLSAVKPLCKGRLAVVFGCGGDRDKTKRARMAAACEKFADIIYVSSDNPRSEKPLDIINDIMQGFSNPSAENITVEPDRKKAIETAIRAAKSGDIILIAGKGHEDYQIIGSQKYHFSDIAVARETLQAVHI